MTSMERTEVPVKLYKSEERLTLAAPMPGLEPQDISISISEGGELDISGQRPGEFKGIKDVVMDEWQTSYHRSLRLDESVDATSANATYENGVLTVSLPITSSLRPAQIRLERVGATEGKHFGASGRP